jgi:branched-chain amino acid transport system substrate-binding protein
MKKSASAWVSVLAATTIVSLLYMGGGASASTLASSPSGSTISVGVIGSLSGPEAPSEDQFGTVGPAWAKYVNAHGGINNHPVKVYVIDDGASPVTAQSAATTLVSTDHVSVVLVATDDYLSAYQQYFASNGIPLLSGITNTQAWYGAKSVYPTVTDQQSNNQSLVYVAKKYGAKKMAELYCSEEAACEDTVTQMKPEAKKLGLSLVSLAVSATAPSYTTQCLTLKQEDVNYVNMSLSGTTAATFVQDCQQQNYNPTYGATLQTVNGALLAVKNMKMYGGAPAFPYSADASAADQYRSAMIKYAKNSNWQGGSSTATWSGLQVLNSVASKISGTPTAASINTALKSVKSNNFNGLLANKVTFTAPVKLGGQNCFFIFGISNEKLTTPEGLHPSCLS